MSDEQCAPPRLVVGIGASAGSLDAVKELLPRLPADRGLSFVLAPHLDLTERDVLAELATRLTTLPVSAIATSVPVVGDRVYVAPSGATVEARNGGLELTAPPADRSVPLPVDHLFRSLALACGPRAAAVVLSVTGSDGTDGLEAIRAAGGLTIAHKALEPGTADLVLDIPSIPQALARFANGRAAGLTQSELARLAVALDEEAQLDLRVYKLETIQRRVLRRMTLSGSADTRAYLERLHDDREERRALVRDLMIRVTDFYRDRDAFRALRERVIDPVVDGAEAGASVRAWVPGCATGEEAYSLAIELLDSVAVHGKRLAVQIFATDIDQDALALGRAATFPQTIADRISPRALATYFKPVAGGRYRARATLRDVVSFAAHDLTKDPPFSRMNLVSCRNVLIYLSSETQRNVLELLHFALEPDGYLFLSPSESTANHRELFATVSKSHRIYRKVGVSHPITMWHSRTRRSLDRPPVPARPARAPAPRPGGAGELARRAVLESWVPPTIVVSEDGTVLFMHGELGPFLRLPQGDDPRLDLPSLLRPEIATRTRGALYKCRRSNQPVVALSSPGTGAGAGGRVRITAKPAPAVGDDAVMLSFEQLDDETREPSERVDGSAHEIVIEQLEQELQATREDLRTAIEELESSNEELRSSNEESMSTNEELQSANEELEATSEELRSLNEELTAVNTQLRDKVEELEQAHDDLHNFFASTKIATVFLDDELRIKRFTPAARDLLGIAGSDVGRFVGDIARDLLHEDLEAEATSVLDDLTARSRELRTRHGRWIARRVLPYRTESQRIEGVVVTFVDVTELKSTSEQLALRERQQSVVARTGMHALRAGDLQGFMDQVVREVGQTLGTDFCKLLELQPGRRNLLLRAGVGWNEGLVGSAYVGADSDSQAGYALRSDGPVIVEDLAVEKRFPAPALLLEHGVVSGISCVIRDGERDYGVISAHTRERRAFSREDADFLQAIAGVVASAIARHQGRKRLAVELAVAHALSEAGSVDEAFSAVLRAMMTELGAVVGEVWWASGDRRELSRRVLCVAGHLDEHHVRERFAGGPVSADRGLIGRVFHDGRSGWCTDLGDPALFLRRDAAAALGLRSGFGLPICAGSEVLGVATVYCTARMFGDELLLRSLDVIGRSIGDHVTRLELEQRMRRLASITESSHDAILSYDDDGTVTEWLSGAEQLFGYSAAEMVGASIDLIVPADRRQELRAINERIRRGEVVDPFETVRVCKDGRVVDVSVRSSPVRDRHGAMIGVSSTDRDVTPQKAIARRLVEADRQKDEFLAMLGHELRNPLAAIRGAAELLALTCGDDPRLQRTQAILDRQTRHMAKLLDGLLDISRMIRGKIALELHVVDLAEICRQVALDVVDRLGGRSLDLRTDVRAEPMWVEADPVRLTQIVDNLLSNAVKYTPDGGTVTLALERQGDTAALTVRDDGVGIEPDLLPHIFEVFRQSEQTIDRSHGGLGLGLALVKALTALHGGEVEARSEGKDRGATFTVRLPLTRATAARDVGAGDAAASGSLRIVLIEDNDDAAEMLRHVLELAGHDVHVARRGRQGVELARERRPDLVLCDLGLPGGMTGFDVARELRADPAMTATRLVALSGYGRPEDKAAGADAGFDAHLTKPIDLRALSQLLASSPSR